MNREDFPMLENNIIYMDNGATTFKPQSVLDKMNEYYTKYCANCHRGDYNISYQVDLEYEDTRDLIQEFIGAANREEIIFTGGTTESLNMIVSGFFSKILERDEEIILSRSEHASNILPWYRLAKNKGAHIKYVDLDEKYHVTLENIKKAVTPKTKVIALAHVTNVIGDIRPIKEICEYAYEKGIFVVIDGAQSTPHMKIDVQDLDCDFFTFSGHKMLGPTGIGVLYGRKELLEEMEPLNLGGGMSDSFESESEVYLKALPNRLEAGTPNIVGVLGLGEAIRYIQSIGLDKIKEHEQNLRKYLVEKLILIPHIDIINMHSDSGIIAFNVDGIFSQDVAYYLNKYNICVRAGNHCAKILKNATGVTNTVRISLYIYNNYEEIDELVELLTDKERILKEMF